MTFDPLAADYDSHFTHTRTARFLRARVHQRMAALWHADDSLLELGCGTGEDARHLALHGLHVTATDASPAMLDHARRKNADIPAERLTFAPLDITHLPPDAYTDVLFDGVLANFGALNVLTDWQPLAAWLAARVRRGGVAAFAVMSPACVGEVLWFGLHGDWRTARRRWSGKAEFRGVTIAYPLPRRLARDFAPHFRVKRVMPVGLYLPPSEAYAAFEARPRLWSLLATLERTAAPSFLARFADHYWIEFERC